MITGEFYSENKALYSVRIIRGSAEGTIELSDDPIHITWDKAKHLYAPLRSIQASIRVRADRDLSFLYTSDPLGCKVYIYETKGVNIRMIFYGFLTPQVWDAPATGEWDEVELVAVDAITALKTVPYTPEAGTNHSFVSPASVLQRAVDLVGANIVTANLPWNERQINEAVFLPKYHDASIHGGDRKSWTDVIEAIGQYLRVTFVLDGINLDYKDMDTALTTPITKDLRAMSASNDARKSIEPARSNLAVDFDTSQMIVAPDISDGRVEPAVLLHTSVTPTQDLEHATYTMTDYLTAKDWEPTDGRAGCAAHVYSRYDPYEGFEDDTFCVVGPCQLKLAARKLVYGASNIMVTMDIHGRSDMATQSGYKVLDVFSKKSNIERGNINVTVKIGDSSYTFPGSRQGRNDPELDYGFQTWRRGIARGVTAQGLLNIVIPSGIIVSNVRVEFTKFLYDGSTYVRRDQLPNDGIVGISNSYNDALTISAKLRTNTKPYSEGDILTTDFDKYPYCSAAQYSAPRNRFVLDTELWEHLNPLMTIKDTTLSNQVLAIDGADMDLKRGAVSLSLLETWVS